MSSKFNQNLDDFKIVAYKKKNSKIRAPPATRNSIEDSFVDCTVDKETLKRRILDAKSEISTSDLHESLLSSLQESFNTLEKPQISEIVCFGLGRFTESLTARELLQFYLATCL
ncbi:unnamed protein product [Acanthoscelides obtectus]|uniref:SRR1-like domain-containing protein n=1 Tax=Acanthoscelides obtectus TaxID=200917 RepID=A0A9P0JZ90_ACAOB|nr:unnamed protein product [Acanthoscelides obtectus]CAK1667275.1 hypothetical protein AOBTE_LOCUS25754 [Acanthoscelides obtectus]